VLGPGNIGCLLAFALRGIPKQPKVSLILPRIEAAQSFISRYESSIRVKRDGVTTTRDGFDVEIPNSNIPRYSPRGIINSLIVTTKAHQTVAAIKPIAHKLKRSSTIVFIQNGMGVMEEVNKTLFPDPVSRPNIVLGITTHGAYTSAPFSVIQRGFGNIQLAVVPRDRQPPSHYVPVEEQEESTRFTLEMLLACKELLTLYTSYNELLCLQLEKLAVNAVINPLTTLFDCPNSGLLRNDHISSLMRMILFETSKVVTSMPEIRGAASTTLRFAPDRLEALTMSVARNTGKNISSMLQDMRQGKKTEIDYINGFIVDRGAQLGIPCTGNFMLRASVKAKELMAQRQLEAEIPLVPLTDRGRE